MAQVVITLKIMPDSPDEDLDSIKHKAKAAIKKFGGDVGKEEIVPIAFGLSALNLIFVMDEKIGSTEKLESEIASFPGVSSVQVSDVRRAIG